MSVISGAQISEHPLPSLYPTGMLPDFLGIKRSKPSPPMHFGHSQVYVPGLFLHLACG